MKRIVLLLLTILLISCSSDDDSNAEFIIGDWEVNSAIDQAGNEVELSECAAVSLYRFKSDFTIEVLDNVESDQWPPSVICGTLPAFLYEWRKIDDSKYELFRINSPDDPDKTRPITRNGRFLDMKNNFSELTYRLSKVK